MTARVRPASRAGEPWSPAGRFGSLAVAAPALVLTALVCTANAGAASAAQEVATPTYTNRLIDSNNPYLLLHAHNPVDWYPWGPEALELARREHRPIFLSVGYSTCYWCHVAERTIYSDPAIAASMNAWFVNIKVDREQRPDIDSLYIVATQVMTGRGGWPNNVFLTPDLKPFFAGSYFAAADDAAGRPGFASLLKRLHETWLERPQELERKAESVYAAMRERWSDDASSPRTALAPAERLRIARDALMREYDAADGGFGSGRTRFPRAPALALLLVDYRASRDPATLAAVLRSLDAMALGGLHDHLAGGFHRYSTDRSWSVPHFEKMLYDNAQLLDLYVDAFEITRRPLYRDIAVETADYLVQRLSVPDGGFAAAQDAEVDGIEGASYLWSHGEIEAALGSDEARRFFEVYELTPAGGVEGGSQAALRGGVLRARATVGTSEATSAALASQGKARALLLALRDRRPQPARDDKIVVGWNGLAISALARSSKVLGHDSYLAAARAAAERIWALAADPASGSLRHEIFRGRAQTNAFPDDYALLGDAFLTLGEVTGEAVWHTRAATLANGLLTAGSVTGDLKVGAGPAPVAAGGLPIRPRDDGDNALPSGSSAAVALLSRLYASTQDLRYATAASRLADDIGRSLDEAPARWPTATAALSRFPLPAADSAARTPSDQATTSAEATLDTAHHVRASGIVRSAADHDELSLTLTIDAGFHVNANPATFDYVVPTTLSIDGVRGLVVSYPAATLIRPPFAPEGMKVYEGTVTLTGSAPAGTLARPDLAAVLKVQACNDQGCLAPARLAPHFAFE